MFQFLLVVQAIIAAALVGVILMQRSEGGGLGMGGSPTGLMSARGAADFLTRATRVLASGFILLSIGLAFVAAREHRTGDVDTSLAKQAPLGAPAQNAPPPSDPLAAAADQAAGAAPAAAAPAAIATPAPTPGATPHRREAAKPEPAARTTAKVTPPPVVSTAPTPAPSPAATPSPGAK